uniref:Uncharacterized protein n=1 Tax=Globodera rostochiensis TaxID=31243 RepID=A0A914HKV2_GLORO
MPPTSFKAQFPATTSSPRGIPFSASAPPVFYHIAPFGPALAAALLFLCVLRMLLRKCQNRLSLFWQRRQPVIRQLCTRHDNHSAALSSSPVHGDSPVSDSNRHEIAPWERPIGSDLSPGSPLFFLHHPDLFFSPPFAYANSPFHSQFFFFPPKYEDALKLPLPARSPLTERRAPTLRIPSLVGRSRLNPSEQSPPPSYEQVRAVVGQQQQQQPSIRLFCQRREYPPTYFSSVGDLPSLSGGSTQGQNDSATGGITTGILSDRPCSSLSLVDDPRALAQRRLRIFVAKSARKVANERREKGGTTAGRRTSGSGGRRAIDGAGRTAEAGGRATNETEDEAEEMPAPAFLSFCEGMRTLSLSHRLSPGAELNVLQFAAAIERKQNKIGILALALALAK